ncbi:MAG: hypothetical protein MUO72_20670 [Bacteroidales bacterium]|nr:hypothetical protein [Bacteroidales bacterium]
MKKNLAGILILFILVMSSCQPRNTRMTSQAETSKSPQNDTLIKSFMKIENSKAVLEVNLNGGSLPDFHLKELPLNPLDWRIKDSTMPDFMGHFVCFDRWGPPSEGEKANGFKHHGEVNTVTWTSLAEPRTINGMITCSMMCSLPMGGLQLTRKIEMPEDEPVFFVTEEIKNLNKYGRMFNIVQHVTIAPPFLDRSTLFDNNAEKGFEDKEDGSLNQEEIVLRWPVAVHNGEKVSLRQFLNDWPRVSSFVYNQDDKYGWVTACNAGKNLMLGYIWEIEDYPWINFWRSMENDVPVAFGMEFGTTGLHEPFTVVAKKGKIFERNIYDFIDASKVITKSYAAFLAKIPEDYKGVDKIEISNSLIIIKEKNIPSRDIIYHFK